MSDVDFLDGEGVDRMVGDVILMVLGGGGSKVGGVLGQVGGGFGLDAVLGGTPKRIACAVKEVSLVGEG